MNADIERLDHKIIFEMVENGSRVLDLGCGDGSLMSALVEGKGVYAQGIEVSDEKIYECVAKGLSVFHGNIDSGLSEYPDKSFDYIILNQSLQEVINVEFVLEEALRVGRRVIVGFSNFAHYKARIDIFFRGRAPVTASLPNPWYETPNLHFLSVNDFIEYCKEKRLRTLRRRYLGKDKLVSFLPNLFALNAIFMIERA